MSTAIGVLLGYVKQFNEKSPPSLIGVAGSYTTTDSWYVSAFAKTHFGEDGKKSAVFTTIDNVISWPIF